MVREYFDANLNGTMADERLSTMVMRSGNASTQSIVFVKVQTYVRLITGLAASHVAQLQAFFAPHHTQTNFPAAEILGNGKNAPRPVVLNCWRSVFL